MACRRLLRPRGRFNIHACFYHVCFYQAQFGRRCGRTVLDRKIADKRIYPAIDITKSGTRREELLFDKNDLQKMNVLRRIIAPMGTMDAIEFINSKLKDTKNNAEFFNSMNKPA